MIDPTAPTTPRLPAPEYLGDAVYALFDGFHVVLRLNSHNNTDGEICLERSVFEALLNYGTKAFGMRSR